MSFKQQALELIIEQVKTFKIKSIHINNKIYDARNINSIQYDYDKDNIWVSKKYLPLFAESDLLSYIYKYFIKEDKKYDYLIMRKVGKTVKINTFNISKHASRAFVKRYLLLYLNKQCHFMLKKSLIEEMEKNFNDLKNFYLSNSDDYSIMNTMIIEFLSRSKSLHGKTITRPRDKRHIANRNQKHGETLRLLSTPFLFVITENNIVTCELFSSSFEFRHINTVRDNHFKNILMKS